MQKCVVQSFGNKKLVNLGLENKRCKIILCDDETHSIAKILLSFKKNHRPHNSLSSSYRAPLALSSLLQSAI